MRKPARSQWDFGELFPAESTPARRVLTVSEVTAQVKRLLERELGRVWVTGEVTNLRVQGSGHVYFTLKDPSSQVSCVFFRGEAAAGRELLEDGRKILVQGDVTVYEPRGQYQIIVRAVELQGVGALQIAFEKLKQKLGAEGLFAADRKRPMPRYPSRIGLVTSPTGAALRDIVHVIRRRDPGLEIILAPCRVQGEGAAGEIAAALGLLNEWAVSEPGTRRRQAGNRIDLILVARGGGSLEDLWAFNEEIVARAIFNSSVPVISAVGHEIDFTIGDLVADVRAATPSAGAEIITEGVHASRDFVSGAVGRAQQRLRRRLLLEEERVESLEGRLSRVHPRHRLDEWSQRLDDLQASLWRRVTYRWRDCLAGWKTARLRFRRLRPSHALTRLRQTVLELRRRLGEHQRRRLGIQRDRVEILEARLRLLSPAGVLGRGYSITTDALTGRIIRSELDAREGMRLNSRVSQGVIRSVVEPVPRSGRPIQGESPGGAASAAEADS